MARAFTAITAVKNLHLSRDFTLRIVPTLQELVNERMTEVLPALQCLYLEEGHPLGPSRDREAIIDVYFLPLIHLSFDSAHSSLCP